MAEKGKKNGADFAELCKKDAAILADNMREARKNVYGMSQAKIADRIGVTTAYINRIENCKCKVPAFIVKRYCQILKVSPEDLLDTGISQLPSGTDEEILDELKALPEKEKRYILGVIQSLKT